MATLTFDHRRPQDFILSEANHLRSRDNGVVASGQGEVAAGTVMGGTIGAMTVYASGDAIGITMYPVDATDSAVAVSVLTRDAEVNLKRLVIPEGSTEEDYEAAVTTALAALGIIVRD